MKQRGVTLIELMIVLAILSILLTLATPSFTDTTDKIRRSDAAERLRSAISNTRTQAILRNQVVTLRAIDGDWSQGWQMVLENGQDGELLHVHERSGRPRIVGNTKVRDQVQFGGMGVPLRSSNGSFFICKRDEAISERKVVLSVVGRTRIEVKDEPRRGCL